MSAERESRIEKALGQAASGDTQAFAEIVREYQSVVFSIGWHFLGDRALAEDLAQEVLLELYRNLKGIESTAHLTHWLRRVAVHRSIDQGRRRKFRRETALEEIQERRQEMRRQTRFFSRDCGRRWRSFRKSSAPWSSCATRKTLVLRKLLNCWRCR